MLIWILLLCLFFVFIASIFFSRTEGYYSETSISQTFFKRIGRYMDPVSAYYYGTYPLDFAYRDLERYHTEVAIGKRYAQRTSIILTGLIRNASRNIEFLQTFHGQLKRSFSSVLFLILENDSIDSTRSKLLEWASWDSDVRILCPPDFESIDHKQCTIIGYEKWWNDRSPDTARIYRLSNLRNFYLDYIEQKIAWKKYPYLFVMDLDLHGQFPLDGIFHSLHSFQKDSSISGIACNGMVHTTYPHSSFPYYYYDSFAYIEYGDTIQWDVLLDKKIHDTTVHSKTTKRYSDSMELDRVTSAFGGFCIYSLPSIFDKEARYSFSSLGKYSCEHSHFHVQLGKLYVNPRMVFMIEEDAV